MALIKYSRLASPEVVRRLRLLHILHLSGDLETCRCQRRSTEFMIFQIRLSNAVVHVTRMTCTTFASKPRSLEYSWRTLHLAGSLDCRRSNPGTLLANMRHAATRNSSGSIATYRASKTTAFMNAADTEGRSQLYRESSAALMVLYDDVR
jgi:hypothetical protein